MELKEFKETIDEMADEIGIYGEKGEIASHRFSGHVSIEGEDDFYVIKSFAYSRLPGCGCPSGIVINIEKDE